MRVKARGPGVEALLCGGRHLFERKTALPVSRILSVCRNFGEASICLFLDVLH